jgi:hypothetical protein
MRAHRFEAQVHDRLGQGRAGLGDTGAGEIVRGDRRLCR